MSLDNTRYAVGFFKSINSFNWELRVGERQFKNGLFQYTPWKISIEKLPAIGEAEEIPAASFLSINMNDMRPLIDAFQDGLEMAGFSQVTQHRGEEIKLLKSEIDFLRNLITNLIAERTKGA